jgi:hypothetical protein
VSSYDGAGNLIGMNCGGALTTQMWSPENKLIGTVSPTENESYLCSADGLRKSQTTATGTTLFTWDGRNELLETSTSGVLQASYTDYPGYWGGLASQNQSGVSSFYGFDSQGNVRILVSSGGAVTDAYSFTVYGEILQSGSGSENPYQFKGRSRFYLGDVGLLYVSSMSTYYLAETGTVLAPYVSAGGMRVYLIPATVLLSTPASPYASWNGCKASDPACTLTQQDVTDNLCPNKKLQNQIANALLASLASDCICAVSFAGDVSFTVTGGCFESQGFACGAAKVQPVCNIITPLSGSCNGMSGSANASCQKLPGCKSTCGDAVDKQPIPTQSLPMPANIPIDHFGCSFRLTKLIGTLTITGSYTSKKCCKRK